MIQSLSKFPPLKISDLTFNTWDSGVISVPRYNNQYPQCIENPILCANKLFKHVFGNTLIAKTWIAHLLYISSSGAIYFWGLREIIIKALWEGVEILTSIQKVWK
jgi:hypothetical protein